MNERDESVKLLGKKLHCLRLEVVPSIANDIWESFIEVERSMKELLDATAEGTWAWALQQMKAGHKVRIEDPRLSYMTLKLVLGIDKFSGEFFEYHRYQDKWIRGSKQFLFQPADFERTDWRLAEEGDEDAATQSETGDR